MTALIKFVGNERRAITFRALGHRFCTLRTPRTGLRHSPQRGRAAQLSPFAAETLLEKGVKPEPRRLRQRLRSEMERRGRTRTGMQGELGRGGNRLPWPGTPLPLAPPAETDPPPLSLAKPQPGQGPWWDTARPAARSPRLNRRPFHAPSPPAARGCCFGSSPGAPAPRCPGPGPALPKDPAPPRGPREASGRRGAGSVGCSKAPCGRARCRARVTM